MKVAYLIDRDAVGGGMEYIRRQIAAHPDGDCLVFFAARGGCTAEAMNAWGADVVHVNHLKALVQLFRNPFVKPKGKIVFTVHGIHLRKYDFLPKTFANRLKRRLRLALERRLYRKCDELIARAQDALRRAGRRTLLIGGGPTFEAVRSRAAKSGISDLLEFAGEIPDAGVYMTCGKVLVAPSRWEGLPYLLLEAVARGRKVIASDCPGNRDVLAGYSPSVLFPVEDAAMLARLMVQEDKAR